MVNAFACVNAKPVSDKHKRELDALYARARQARPDLDDAQLAEILGQTLTENAGIRKHQMLRQAVIQHDIYTRFNAEVANSPDMAQEYLLSLFGTATTRKLKDPPVSVESQQQFEYAVQASLANEFIFATYRARFGTQRAPRAQVADIAREVGGENTSNATAKMIAEGVLKMDDYRVTRLNELGVAATREPGWLPVVHNAMRVAQAGGRAATGGVAYKAWRDFIVPRLALSKMIDRETGLPFDEASLEPVLREVFDNITTEGAAGLVPGAQGRTTLAKRLQQERFFQWKNVDSWMEYDEQFGSGGNFEELLVGSMVKSSRDIARVARLGADPGGTVRFIEDLARKADAARGPLAAGGSAYQAQIRRMNDATSGAMATPENVAWAQGLASARNLFTSAALGSVSVAALFSDNSFAMMARHMNGLSAVRQMPQFLENLFAQAGGRKSDRARLAARLGLALDMYSSGAYSAQRFLGEIDGARLSHTVTEVVMKTSGLTQFTQASKWAWGFENLMTLGEAATKGWESLHPRYREVLGFYGVDEASFKRVMSNPQAIATERGVPYLDLPTIGREIDSDFAARMYQMIQTEGLHATPNANARTLAFTSARGRPGSLEGEIIRSGTQWLQFPLSVWQGQIMARFNDPFRSGLPKAAQFATYALTTTLSGIMVSWAYDIAAGRDPAPLVMSDGSPNVRLLMRAIQLGGGFGILGDALVKDSDAYGGSFVGNFTGPIGQAVDNVWSLTAGSAQKALRGEDVNAGGSAVRLLKSLTPGASLFYTRAAVERLVFDQLEMMVDADAKRKSIRRQRQMVREQEQRYFLPRYPDVGREGVAGAVTPERAPDFNIVR